MKLEACKTGRAVPLVLAASLIAGTSLVPVAATAQEDDPRIEAMQRQIEELQRQLEELRDDVTETKALPPPPAPDPADAPKVVTSGNDKIKLAISGQVNRGILVSNDGDQTKFFNVDNDNSSTRVRFIGTGQVSDDFAAGARLEIEVESNSSSKVSQDNESTGSADFGDRWAEVFFDSKTFGKLSLGQGDTASNNTSEVDLSGTGVVGYASVADSAGGLQFVDNGNELSGVTIGNMFNDFDGLSRDDRIRYDTPKFAGFSLATSAIADSNFDVAGFYSAALGEHKLAAAAAWASNSGDFDQYNGSASLLLGGFLKGVNATVAAGFRDNQGGRDDSNFGYAKLGYRMQPFEFGETALSVDVYKGSDVGDDGDNSTSYGAQAVQNVDAIATEIYVGYRLYSAFRRNTDFDDVNTLLTGARVKF